MIFPANETSRACHAWLPRTGVGMDLNIYCIDTLHGSYGLSTYLIYEDITDNDGWWRYLWDFNLIEHEIDNTAIGDIYGKQKDCFGGMITAVEGLI